MEQAELLMLQEAIMHNYTEWAIKKLSPTGQLIKSSKSNVHLN